MKNRWKSRSGGVQNRRKSLSGGVLAGFGASWGVLGAVARFWRTFWRHCGEDGRNMGQVGAKLRPRWAMLAPRWPCWDQFGRLWLNFGNIFGAFWQMRWISKNFFKPKLSQASGGFGVVGWDGWGILAAVLVDVGSKMALFGWCWGDVAPCCGQDGDQERQDEGT